MNFFSKYKKIFLVIAFVATALILGYFNYLLFFKAPSRPATSEQEPKSGGSGLPSANEGTGQIIDPAKNSGLPQENRQPVIPEKKIDPSANGGLTRTTELTKSPALGAKLNSNGSEINYYDTGDGKFYKIGKDGGASPLSDKIFHNVSDVTWSKTGNKAILEYPDGANIVYNFDTKKQVTLPSHWKDFDFSPSGDKIISKSMADDPDNRWLIISGENGAQTQAIERLGTKDETVYPSWSPNNKIVATFTESKGFDRQEVYFVGLNHENFKSATIEGRGFDPKWSTDGDKLLYSIYSSENNLKPSLWIVNAEGENIGTGRKNLNIETWANKCTFADNTSLFCAVPEKLDEGAGLFPELAKTTNDRLYKIDTKTGLKKLVAVPDGEYTMSNLIVSENGYRLYFTDEKTGKLRMIDLK